VYLRRSAKGIATFFQSLLLIVDSIHELVHELVSRLCSLALLLAFQLHDS
jgi:hypothetical protein